MSTDTPQPETTEEKPKDEQLLALVALGKHMHELAENSKQTAKDMKEINASLKNISAVVTLMLLALVLYLIFLSKFLARGL